MLARFCLLRLAQEEEVRMHSAAQRLAKAEQVAQVLDMKKARVYQLARDVFPPGVVVRVGRQTRFDLAALYVWIERGGTLAK